MADTLAMTKVLVFSNQKGGVGKTTLASTFSHLLSKKHRLLAIDWDPQSNLTWALGAMVEAQDESTSITHFLNEDEFNPIEISKKLHLLSGDIGLSVYQRQHFNDKNYALNLKNKLESLKEEYDIILIDTPPSLGFLTINALAVATHLIMPMHADAFSLQGIIQMLGTIDSLDENLGLPAPEKRLVLNHHRPRVNLCKMVEEQLRESYGKMVFKTTLPMNNSLREAALAGEPVHEYAPKSRITEAMKKLNREINTWLFPKR